MRICQILAGDEEGGLEKHFEELCNKIAQTEEVHVIAHEKYRERFASNVVFHALDLSRGRKNLVILYKLRQIINHIAPDIVHAHANKAVDMVANIKYFLKPSIKMVATLHSKKRKLKSFEKFDYVIGVSHEVLKALKNPHQSVVYNGISLTTKERNPQYLSQFGIQDEFVVCSVGRLESVKNFSLLIRAVRDLDVKLLIVGEGSEEKKLKSTVAALALEEKVIFTGFRKDVQNLLAHSDLCVISSDREGFSYVMAEALLLGTPVVSTDVGDMKRILPLSCVVPVNDVKSLSLKIHFTQEHYTDVLEEYKPSFRFAIEHFTLDAMVTGTLEVYNKVMKR
jgi:glycosyltransferase involved in cell wall biosynthesis